MVSLKITSATLVLAISAAFVQGAPLRHQKRIAQVIADSTAQWEQACLAAGGGQQCNPQSIASFSTLLAAAGDCDQQNEADNMIDLAKSLNNDATMIQLTQIFVQQPRNTPNSVAVPYCQQAPRNSELNGLFQCQYQGANQQTFVGGLQLGAAGTIPFGLSAPLNPLGSCLANPSGPLADGSQLVDQTQDPGVGNTPQTSNAAAGSGNDNQDNGDDSQDDNGDDNSDDNGDDSGDDDSGNDDSGDDNGDDQDNGDDNSDDVGSSDELAPTSCPANNSAAPSASASPQSNDAPAAPAAPAANNNAGAGGFKLQNGKDAQALNAQFAGLTADSSCNAGDNACVDGAFAQCVGGKFVTTGCAGGLQCFALPLVNSPGTSVTCTTQSDALARIAATGASGGLTGN